MPRVPHSLGPIPLFFFLGVALAPDALAAPPGGREDPPAPHRSTEVAFAGHGGFELSGTLTLPADGDAAPALVLLPGSGPTDRDGNQPPGFVTDLLRQIAERLAGEGWASLRFDKRAAHVHLAAILAMGPEEQREFLAYEAFVGDARAAIDLLRETEGVDASRIGILGHSEGGLIALSLANELGAGDDGVRLLVLAATPGRPLADVLRTQIGRQLRVLPESARDKFLAELDRTMAAVIETGHAPDDLTDPGLMALFPPNATKLLQVELALDPAALARSYAGPVLVLQGELDAQVAAVDHSGLLAEALAEREDDRHRVAVIPTASHNFKPVESLGELGLSGDVVPATFDALVPWLHEALPGRRP
jgi:pimeloyl-ACP methyl ester carboxylesterase